MTNSELLLIVDMSGSMGGLENATRRNIANFITEQKGVEGNANLSLILFDDKYEIVFWRRNIQEVSPEQSYYVRGSTALRDAMGKSIDRLFRELNLEKNRPDHVIVNVITDGLENASTRYSAEELKSMIDAMRNVFGWNIIFMGADKRSLIEAQNWGIPQNLTVNYVADEKGIGESYTAMSSMTRSFRTGGE